jgi:DNA-binding response OmpR family regulator
VVLDITLPDGNGYGLAEFTKKNSNSPILFLTAKDDEEDIVKGLELGAEDYITKPFKSKELVARINKILKRNDGIIILDNIKIDINAAKVFKGSVEISLTALEYKILSFLVKNAGKIISRDTLIDKIWDVDGNFVNDNTLTVSIKRIREKLGNNDIIKTIKGLGYMVEENENN